MTRDRCAAISLRDFSVYHGKVCAVSGVTINVEPGSIVSVIGPNGAGKSTLLNGIMGILDSTGELLFEGCTGQSKIETRVKQGMSLVPEKRELFGSMTVQDNLLLGAYVRAGWFSKNVKTEREKVYAIFPRLFERRQQLAGTLSGGERQMLAIGRALMSSPKLLMLDEPSLGLAPRVVQEVLDTVATLAVSGVAVLLVEQNAKAALEISNYGYVLENGCIVIEGVAASLARDPRILKTYLGSSDSTTNLPN